MFDLIQILMIIVALNLTWINLLNVRLSNTQKAITFLGTLVISYMLFVIFNGMVSGYGSILFLIWYSRKLDVKWPYAIFSSLTAFTILILANLTADAILSIFAWAYAFFVGQKELVEVSTAILYNAVWDIWVIGMSWISSKEVGKVIERYKKRLDEVIQSRYTMMGFAIVLLSFVMLYTFIHFSKSQILPQWIVVLGVGIFVFLSIGCLILLLHTALSDYQKKCKELELQRLQEYTDELESLYKEIRKFKHDYINILSSMSGYIEEGNYKALKDYFKTVVVNYSKKIEIEDYHLSILSNVKMIELKGILSNKIIQAYKHELKMTIEVTEVIDRIDIDIIDLCRMVGILLDNAIEAACESVEKVLELALIRNNDCVSIVISNSMPNNQLPIYEIYKEGISSKGSNRGIGLSNYKELASRYQNVLTDTVIDENRFVQILQVQQI